MKDQATNVVSHTEHVLSPSKSCWHYSMSSTIRIVDLNAGQIKGMPGSRHDQYTRPGRPGAYLVVVAAAYSQRATGLEIGGTFKKNRRNLLQRMALGLIEDSRAAKGRLWPH